MVTMWMVRGEGGRLYEDFRERGVAAIGWSQLAPFAKPGMSRKQLTDLYRTVETHAKQGTIISGASQVWRFLNEMEVGDDVITYSPSNRTYSIGRIAGAAVYRADWVNIDMALVRPVEWQTSEVDRDSLSTASKNSLGSTLTVFQLPESARKELLALVSGKSSPILAVEESTEEYVVDPLADISTLARERIKDLVSGLAWDEMQNLIAGILRAMKYKTQVSPAGPDRGKDIIASPDGFGFEHPRIVVEVKHRPGQQMGSQEVRSFLGGRHKDDRGLYVSTGGFTKDAQYEADRASIPMSLWTLDHVVRALIENYDTTDAETKRIVPLKRLYWPA